MKTGSERQKMQCKNSEAAETRGSDSAFFFWFFSTVCAQGGLRVRVDDASM
jgi:hypothetical protein